MYVKKESQLRTEHPSLRGGEGIARFRQLLTPEQFCGHGRIFSVISLEPGHSIGWHVHTGESETFYVLRGQATLNDNGETVTLLPGDCSYTASGEGHAIKNEGSELLEVLALVIND